MINRILIHNSPAFKEVELYLQGGFNVFSGASGSGKSVFMESLLAIFGIKESNADLIEANIDVSRIKFDWDSYGIPNDLENEIVLSIVKKDKTRYFLNHTSSSKKRLNELVCGFAKHISTKSGDELSPQNLLRILDYLIAKTHKAHLELLTNYERDFLALQEAQKQLKDVESKEANIATLKEFATFEIQKIQSLQPKEGEYEELLALKKMLSKQERIKEQMYKVREALQATQHFEEFLSLIDEKCPTLLEGLSEFEAIMERQEERLSEIEGLNPESMLDKIAAYAELNRRFGGVKEALAYVEEQKLKLKEYENLTFNKQELEKQIKVLRESCENMAKKLFDNRSKSLEALNTKITELCTQLRLKASVLKLQEVAMQKSGNCELILKLGDADVSVLSSGEYNRLRLAIMCIDTELTPRSGILVLDEIDANLSGEESEGAAKILKMLSKDYQIFAISHQTHMPSLADTHYLVEKAQDSSVITKLDFEGRVKEIARMISGANITNEAMEFARKHLKALKE